MTVQILYFAVLRDLVGKAEERLTLPPSVATLRDLAEHLVLLHEPLAGRLGPVRFARNESFVALDAPVADGDVVALIPPVSGG